MNTIQIGNKTYVGTNIQIRNGEVIIDGVKQMDKEHTVLNIVLNGEIQHFSCDQRVEVKGGLIHDLKCGGSVSCDDITGNVQAGGSVSCDGIGGDVSCGGSISM